MISTISLEKINKLISEGNEHAFYTTASWQNVRDMVLELDNFECQSCKAKGRYKKAKIVHHIQHLKDRPDLALSIYDPDTGRRQLISVCATCHAKEHPERAKNLCPPWVKADAITKERWD